jgi:hypothetical protein
MRIAIAESLLRAASARRDGSGAKCQMHPVPPVRAAWSTKELQAAFGTRYRVAAAGTDPLARVTPGGPRALVLFKYAVITVRHKFQVADARPELAVRHVFDPDPSTGGMGGKWAFSNQDAHRLDEDAEARLDSSWADNPLAVESWCVDRGESGGGAVRVSQLMPPEDPAPHVDVFTMVRRASIALLRSWSWSRCCGPRW